jgi:perosamine synthetase
MYVSSWPGLRLRELLPSRSVCPMPYPLNSKNRVSFCVARSGIYHLFLTLRFQPGETVLVPDYYSGNEVAAIRAAGATISFYPIRRNLEPDLDALGHLARQGPRAIYVIHYLGWPQPIQEIRSLCRAHRSILIEDCALSLLSGTGSNALGTFGDYSVFCLYKTLPVPNGGVLVRNNSGLPGIENVKLDRCPRLSTVGRSGELILEKIRSRSNGIGGPLSTVKQLLGRMMRAARVRHVPVGDIGWDIRNVNLAMSHLSDVVMARLDFESIRRVRRANFEMLREKLEGRAKMLRQDLPEGVCPLFFPILVRNKQFVASALRRYGIGAVEFWSDRQDNPSVGPGARYLRSHVLELPIHQGVTPEQIGYMADQVRRLDPEPASC